MIRIHKTCIELKTGESWSIGFYMFLKASKSDIMRYLNRKPYIYGMSRYVLCDHALSLLRLHAVLLYEALESKVLTFQVVKTLSILRQLRQLVATCIASVGALFWSLMLLLFLKLVFALMISPLGSFEGLKRCRSSDRALHSERGGGPADSTPHVQLVGQLPEGHVHHAAGKHSVSEPEQCHCLDLPTIITTAYIDLKCH